MCEINAVYESYKQSGGIDGESDIAELAYSVIDRAAARFSGESRSGENAAKGQVYRR